MLKWKKKPKTRMKLLIQSTDRWLKDNKTIIERHIFSLHSGDCQGVIFWLSFPVNTYMHYKIHMRRNRGGGVRGGLAPPTFFFANLYIPKTFFFLLVTIFDKSCPPTPHFQFPSDPNEVSFTIFITWYMYMYIVSMIKLLNFSYSMLRVPVPM